MTRPPVPEVVIRPFRALSREDLLDVWRYRGLLWTLGLRDVRVRYKQAFLGVAWAVLQPLVQMVVFTVLFHRLAGIGGGVDYSAFCLSGLVAWTLFSNGLAHMTSSLVDSADLVTKVWFPRVILPLAAMVTVLVDYAIGLVLLALAMLVLHVPFHWTSPLAALVGVLAAGCALAFGLWTSALNIQYRDVRFALPFVFQLLVFVTPVFYPSSLVPLRWRFLLDLNPMAAVVDSFRAVLFGDALPWERLGISALTCALVGVLGFVYFRRVERTVADRL